jgi:GNAT superfamily N-acetyltransferase
MSIDPISFPANKTCGPRLATPLTIVLLQAGHRAELEEFFRGLDEPSRIGRFNHAVSDAYLTAHARIALSTADWVAGAFCNGRLCGVVETYEYPELGFIELAVAVELEWRDQGIGSALLRAATDWAAGSGVPMLRMVFTRSNLAMRKLAQEVGARLDLVFDEMTADIDLRRRDRGIRAIHRRQPRLS